MNTPDTVTDAAREAIKALFIAERGYWRPWTDTLLQLSPGFVQQYALRGLPGPHRPADGAHG
ncbi:hypothetical protein LP417_22310 [Polaromonas sp. P1-6]|nr:hypothetical protein LP417_22310 [Polaromonas sp. P1-6]